MSDVQQLLDALDHLVSGIVDHPEDVKVTARSPFRGRNQRGNGDNGRGPRPGQDRRSELLEVRVNPEDLGRVIGRNGRTARALRTVIGAIADSPVRVDVIDVDRGR